MKKITIKKKLALWALPAVALAFAMPSTSSAFNFAFSGAIARTAGLRVFPFIGEVSLHRSQISENFDFREYAIDAGCGSRIRPVNAGECHGDLETKILNNMY
jgi:hypothetical protein